MHEIVTQSSILVKRDDLIDPIVSGNKWRKLKYYFLAAEYEKKDTILTFGGAFSNHLIATAKAGKLANYKTIGIVRGDELNENSNSILQQCSAWGMQLEFIPRSTYLLRTDKSFLNHLHEKHINSLVIPEGGAGYYGMVGCQEIWKELKNTTIDSLFLAAGTGTTTAGILLGAPQNIKIYCVPVLAGNFMQKNIRQLLSSALFDDEMVEIKMNQLVVLDHYHFGKYAKTTPELLRFINKVREETQLPLDKIYTGKAFFALIDSFRKGLLSKQNKCLFLHTGGIQS